MSLGIFDSFGAAGGGVGVRVSYVVCMGSQGTLHIHAC